MWAELANQMFAYPDFHILVIIMYHMFVEVPDATIDYIEYKLFPNY